MRDQDAWLCFEDEAGQSLRPPKARTWSRRGTTPAVRVSGKGSDRVSLAGLVCTRPGRRTRLIFRMLVHHNRKGEKKGFNEADFAALLDAAHQQLGGPIVLVWDNATQHKACRTDQEDQGVVRGVRWHLRLAEDHLRPVGRGLAGLPERRRGDHV